MSSLLFNYDLHFYKAEEVLEQCVRKRGDPTRLDREFSTSPLSNPYSPLPKNIDTLVSLGTLFADPVSGKQGIGGSQSTGIESFKL